MASYNNGKSIDIDDIKDYEQAAKDFAEGNLNLENLLLNCFRRGIKTRACCADGKELPYISFEYNEENIPYLYAILSQLHDKGYSFDFMIYDKLYLANYSSINKGSLMIQEKSTYDFKTPTTLFRELDEIIRNFDYSKDYYEELPIDLQKYVDVINIAHNNQFLMIKPLVLGGTFRMFYEKNDEGYQYAVMTKDIKYNEILKNTEFQRIDDGWSSYYVLQVPKREEATDSLNQIIMETKRFSDFDNNFHR